MKTRLMLTGTLLGAGIAYLLNSNRRDSLRDKVAQMQREGTEAFDDAAHTIVDRTKDAAYEVRERVTGHDITDDVLLSLINAEMERVVSNASQIEAKVRDGHIVISGPILSTEVDELIRRLEEMPGVKSVDNRLRVYG